MKPYDVLIVGAGLVGASLARALAGSPLRVALLEQAPPPSMPTLWDSRVYAISPACERFLRQIGIWQAMDATRLQAVHAMEIKGDAGGALQFSAQSVHQTHLTYIIESSQMQHALWQSLQNQDNLDIICPATLDHLTFLPQMAEAHLQDGRVVAANLIVGADGAHSAVRKQAGIAVQEDDYDTLGVVATFACERPHGSIARQWFRGGDILACLPLPSQNGRNYFSIVWSCPTAQAHVLMSLSASDLAQQVHTASGGVLGALEALSPALGFPLKRRKAAQQTAHRVALIGDAAHTVHPLAGQGLNLGYKDAQMLAKLLVSGKIQGVDLGSATWLRRFARERAEDIWAMQQVTHGLHHLFAATPPLLRTLRNTGLSLTHHAGFLKRQLIQHALA